MINWIKSKLKKNITKPVVAKFKVRVKGEELVEVVLTGKTAKNVADLTNRLRSSLCVSVNKFDQYVAMSEDVKAVFEEADKVFQKADKIFKKHK